MYAVFQTLDSVFRLSWPLQHGIDASQARSVSNYASNCHRLQYIENISLPVGPELLLLSSSLLPFSLLNMRQTSSRCVMLLIIRTTKYSVCVSGMMFAPLADVQMCQVALVCLLSWLKQLTGQLMFNCIWVSFSQLRSEWDVLVILQFVHTCGTQTGKTAANGPVVALMLVYF